MQLLKSNREIGSTSQWQLFADVSIDPSAPVNQIAHRMLQQLVLLYFVQIAHLYLQVNRT